MEHTLNNFKSQQLNSLELLNKLKHFLNQGSEAGVEIDSALEHKLEHAIENVAGDKLKVALIGGFSEGKTSIAAAWMEKLDKSTMKISHQESSNEVKIYEVGEEFVLIDTPGLFGFKERKNTETGAFEKYKDITKKYVSEAHLILYVVNPTNPIKESHKEDLHWLFRTLNLLPRTVFVLSRFDEVADVEDSEDYQENLSIKRENVLGRLHDLISLSEEETKEVTIVAVAANPFDMGTEHWLANIEQFHSLSHIDKLQTATAKKINNNGGNVALIKEMHASVIRDVLNEQLPAAIKNDQKISEQVSRLNELYLRLKQQLQATNQQIEEARIGLREFAQSYFSDLILQTNGCSIDTFDEFFQREIGSDGVIVTTRIQNEFSHRTSSVLLEVEKMQVSLNTEVNHFNNTMKEMGKNGINHVIKGNLINNKTVIATRDGINTVTKAVGLDIAKHLKFKSWGAINLAKGINSALVVIGVALEAWDSWKQHKQEEEFKKAIQQIVSKLEGQRKDLLELVNSEEFKSKFFEAYRIIEKQLGELKTNLNESQIRQKQFRAWREEAEAIDAEFSEIS